MVTAITKRTNFADIRNISFWEVKTNITWIRLLSQINIYIFANPRVFRATWQSPMKCQLKPEALLFIVS